MTDAPRNDPGRRATPRHLLHQLVARIETDTSLDHRAAVLDGVASPLARSQAGPLLRGEQMGHAVHPFLTDFPLGCWTSAMLLDLVGGPSSRSAARRLTGLGLLGVVPTVLTGLAEYDALDELPSRRVASVHAVGNSIAAGCQFLSWRARRKERFVRGVGWGLAGNSAAAVAGYLGGHLAFARDAGQGDRSGDTPLAGATSASGVGRPSATPPPPHEERRPSEPEALIDDGEAARLLGVTVDRIDELVAQGLLDTANAEQPGARWFRHTDVDALRLVGG